jgi:RNA polymerase sigma-70 factor (ECF subfamily)
MSADASSPSPADRQAFVAAAVALRPQLHRYCARLTGSVFDGEDVVQDTMVRALAALEDLDPLPALRPWLYRIAHNRAIDLLRARALREMESLDVSAAQSPDRGALDAEEGLMRQEAVCLAVSRFTELPTTQRSVIILKDVLDHSLVDIAELLDLSVDAVKAHLARGRVRLRAISARSSSAWQTPPISASAERYAKLFNAGRWDELRAMLADDVRLDLSGRPSRLGAGDVGVYFSVYAGIKDVRLVPGWVEGREVFLVYAGQDSASPAYFVQIVWRNGRIGLIRDYHYTRYVIEDAEFAVSAPH